jgi:hypothetical protein
MGLLDCPGRVVSRSGLFLSLSDGGATMGSNMHLETLTDSPLRYDYGAMMDITVGRTYTLLMPYSEVCDHMRIAGTLQTVLVKDNGVYLDSGAGPHLTYGEAGIYTNNVDGRFAHDYYRDPRA